MIQKARKPVDPRTQGIPPVPLLRVTVAPLESGPVLLRKRLICLRESELLSGSFYSLMDQTGFGSLIKCTPAIAYAPK